MTGTTNAAVRRGLTLLELMLALSLSTVILVVVGMAIDLNLRALDSRRTVVEDAQLARALLTLIANDLRGAIEKSSVDFSSVAALASDSIPEGMDLEGIDLEGLEDAAGAMGLDTSALNDVASTPSEDIASSTTPPPEPGLYGNQYELLVDTSRLPRVDQFQRMLSADSQLKLDDIPSDVKTVAYYVVTATSGGLTPPTQLNGAEDTPQYGLARRVLDRAVTLRASESSSANSLQQSAEIIAPEVVGIEFQYFDGAEWQTEWDSSEQGGLPVAVRILLAINSVQANASQTDLSTLGTSFSNVETPHLIYSLVVRIPIARPTAEEDTATSEDMQAVGL